VPLTSEDGDGLGFVVCWRGLVFKTGRPWLGSEPPSLPPSQKHLRTTHLGCGSYWLLCSALLYSTPGGARAGYTGYYLPMPCTALALLKASARVRVRVPATVPCCLGSGAWGMGLSGPGSGQRLLFSFSFPCCRQRENECNIQSSGTGVSPRHVQRSLPLQLHPPQVRAPCTHASIPCFQPPRHCVCIHMRGLMRG
jgi:hypothetical protein